MISRDSEVTGTGFELHFLNVFALSESRINYEKELIKIRKTIIFAIVMVGRSCLNILVVIFKKCDFKVLSVALLFMEEYDRYLNLLYVREVNFGKQKVHYHKKGKFSKQIFYLALQQ